MPDGKVRKITPAEFAVQSESLLEQGAEFDFSEFNKVVKGRKISGYYSMKDDLVNAGATYTDLPAVIDHNIVTTAHYKDLGPWMKAVLKVFYDKHKNQS